MAKDFRKSLMGSSTMPFGTGGALNFTVTGHGHHHHHHADGSCCGPAHDGDEDLSEEVASSCGHNHALGENCKG